MPVLMQMPASLEEAAYDLGANRWFTFTRVTLPLMRTGLVGGVAFAFLTSFDNFPMSLFLAEGEKATLPVVMFQFIEFDLTPVILSMSTLVISGIGRGDVRSREGGGNGGPARAARALACGG